MQKHLFWPMVCSGMGGWGATPEPTCYFLALCISKRPILGMQTHVFWPKMCSGMGGWGATPEPRCYFLALCCSKTPILGIQKHFFWPKMCSGMSGWGTTPEPTCYFLALCSSKRPIPGMPIPGMQKNPFSGPWRAVVWLVGAPPQNPDNIFWHCAVQRDLF